jgi:hypothetical protein
MSDTLYDPFSAAANIGQPQLPSQQPGMLGVAPSTWESIAQLGAGAIQGANQRTASGHLAGGTGIAGGVAGAVQGYFGDVQNQAKMRSELANQSAQTTGLNLGNEAAASSLGVTKARNSIVQRMLSDPGFMQQLSGAMGNGGVGAGPGLAGGVVGGGGVAGGPLQSAVLRNESGSAGPNASGVVGDGGQAGGPMQVHQGAIDDFNRAHGTNVSFQQAVDNQNGIGTQVGNWYLQKQVQQFGPTMGLAAYNAGPGRVQQAIQSGQGMAALPQSTQGYVQRAMPGSVDPQTALATSQRLMQQANQIEVYKSLGLPIPGDPAVIRAQAQDYLKLAMADPMARASKGAEADVEMQTAGPIQQQKSAAEAGVKLATAGPIKAAESANSNVDLRPGGMARVVGPDGKSEWMKNPQLEKVQQADGTTTYAHVAPAMPGSAPGTPGTAEPVLGADGKPLVEAIPHNVQLARNKAYEDFQGKDTDSYLAAQNTHGWLEQMNHAADVLNSGGGFLATGPNAPERLAFANTVNDALRTVGLPNAFDPQKIASWEELKKATTTAGFELSSHYEGHARQAASTIENATSAVPSAANTPVGFKTVLAGIQESAQQAIDLHEYKQQIFNQGGDLARAEVDFYKQNRPQQYAQRAISSVHPYPVKAAGDLNRYLPGTYVTLPNGKLTQVPSREGAPPIPSYLSTPAPTPHEGQ